MFLRVLGILFLFCKVTANSMVSQLPPPIPKCPEETNCEKPLICEPIKTCSGIFIEGDYLFWKADVNGFPYVITSHFNLNDIVSFPDDENIKEVSFSYDQGYRIGLGYQFPKGWNVISRWTDFQTDAKALVKAPESLISPDILELIWGSVTIVGRATSIAPHQFVKYQNLDACIEKSIYLGSHFLFSPFFGFDYILVNQKLLLNAQMFIEKSGTIFENTKIINNFNGDGLKIGFSVNYLPLKWLIFYGQGSYSIVAGHFSLKETDDSILPFLNNQILTHHQKATEHSCVNCFDIKTGLKLKGSWCKERLQILLHASYEFVFLPNQVRAKRILPIGEGAILSALFLGNGNVAFHGLTTGIEIRF